MCIYIGAENNALAIAQFINIIFLYVNCLHFLYASFRSVNDFYEIQFINFSWDHLW